MLRCSSLLGLLLGACATSAPAPEFDPRTLAVWEFLRAKYDRDGDGRVERGEYERDDQAFFHLDADRDGVVTRLDFARQWDGRPRTADGSFVYGEGGPELGDAAPAFALPDLEGRVRTLSELCAERPVVLVFGSYTWGPFCAAAGRLRELHARFGEVVQFVTVYIQEAHPIDGFVPERHTETWLMGSPERQLLIEDPRTDEERLALARRTQEELGFAWPMLVDRLDDAVNHAYAAWPERLYLVDVGGTVVYRGGKGPMDFEPDELAAVLEELAAFYGAPAHR